MKQVFISYDSGSDSQFANRLAQNLDKLNVDVWIAPSSIRPGEEWVDAIGRGLETSSHFALVSTPSAYQSKWVRKEFNAALLLEADGDIEVIPLEVITTKIPIFLRAFQSISFVNKFEAGFQQLASVLGVTEALDDGLPNFTLENFRDDNHVLIDRGTSTSTNVPISTGIAKGRDRSRERRVFVAYDVRDREYAESLSRFLEIQGIPKWMAPNSIGLGARWDVAIVDAIVDSTAMIVLMSPRSERSQWVQQELLVAEREGVPVYPVLLAGESFATLRNYQFFDARDGQLPSERFIESLKRRTAR